MSISLIMYWRLRRPTLLYYEVPIAQNCRMVSGLNTQITRDKVAHHGVLVRCCPCAITPPHSTKLFSHGNETLDRKATEGMDWFRCMI
eukprot:scaffold10945_cov70-Attheya_sp.AAC.1